MAKKAKPKPTVTVRVECVQCGARKDIGPGDVEPGMVPLCDKCYGPMATISARAVIK